MSAKGGIRQAHGQGPFINKHKRDIAEAQAAKYASVRQKEIDKGTPVAEAEQIAALSADEYFSATPRHQRVENKDKSKSFGQDAIKNISKPLNDEKKDIESVIKRLERQLVSDKLLVGQYTADNQPDEDMIYELESRISSNTRVLERNQLRLSHIETRLHNIREFNGGKKQSKKYNKSNKRTQRRRVRKNNTRRTHI